MCFRGHVERFETTDIADLVASWWKAAELKFRGDYRLNQCEWTNVVEEACGILAQKILGKLGVQQGGDKRSQAFKNCAIRTFNLTVSLRIIRCSVDHFSLESGKDVSPEGGGGLRPLIGKKSLRKARMSEHMLNEKEAAFSAELCWGQAASRSISVSLSMKTRLQVLDSGVASEPGMKGPRKSSDTVCQRDGAVTGVDGVGFGGRVTLFRMQRQTTEELSNHILLARHVLNRFGVPGPQQQAQEGETSIKKAAAQPVTLPFPPQQHEVIELLGNEEPLKPHGRWLVKQHTPEDEQQQREREETAPKLCFQSYNIKHVGEAKRVLRDPTNQEILKHKELLYLHWRLKAYRALQEMCGGLGRTVRRWPKAVIGLPHPRVSRRT
ncbi:hypothetical protein Esti_000224 [Eimeria stiedai]